MKSAPEKIAEKKAPLDAKRGKRGGARPGAGRPKGTTGIPSPGSGGARPGAGHPKGVPNPNAGRKPVFKDSTNLNIRIDRVTLNMLEDYAKRTKQKKSTILRNLILENCG